MKLKFRTLATLVVNMKLTPDIKTELKGVGFFVKVLHRKYYLERSGPDAHVTRHNQAKYLYHANQQSYSDECIIRCRPRGLLAPISRAEPRQSLHRKRSFEEVARERACPTLEKPGVGTWLFQRIDCLWNALHSRQHRKGYSHHRLEPGRQGFVASEKRQSLDWRPSRHSWNPNHRGGSAVSPKPRHKHL